MAFIIGKLPALTPLARWRLALAVTEALDFASLGVLLASVAAMAARFLSCGDECPVSRTTQTVFTVSLFFSGMDTSVYALLKIIVARIEANKHEAVTLKSLGVIVIFQHLVPAACSFLLIVSTLLELSSAKGSPMETLSYVFMYVAVGVMALILVVLIAAMAVLLCWLVAICVMTVWEFCSTVLCWLVAICVMTVWEFCSTVKTSLEEIDICEDEQGATSTIP